MHSLGRLLLLSLLLGLVSSSPPCACSNTNSVDECVESVLAINCSDEHAEECKAFVEHCEIDMVIYEDLIEDICSEHNTKTALCRVLRSKELTTISSMGRKLGSSEDYDITMSTVIQSLRKICEFKSDIDDYCTKSMKELHGQKQAGDVLDKACEQNSQTPNLCIFLTKLSIDDDLPPLKEVFEERCTLDVQFRKYLCQTYNDYAPDNPHVKATREMGYLIGDVKRWTSDILKGYCINGTAYCNLFLEEARRSVNVADVLLIDTCRVENGLLQFCTAFLEKASNSPAKFPALYKRHCTNHPDKSNLCTEMAKLCSGKRGKECKDVNFATCYNQNATSQICGQTFDLYCEDIHSCGELMGKANGNLLQEVVTTKCANLESEICKTIVKVAIDSANLNVIGTAYKPECEAEICKEIITFCSTRSVKQCFVVNKDACERDAEKCLLPIENFCKIEDSRECRELHNSTLKVIATDKDSLPKIFNGLCHLKENVFARHVQFCEDLATLCTNDGGYCADIKNTLVSHQAFSLATSQASVDLLTDPVDKICSEDSVLCRNIFAIYNKDVELFAQLCNRTNDLSCTVVAKIATEVNKPEVEKTFRSECGKDWEKPICTALQKACDIVKSSSNCKFIMNHRQMMSKLVEFQKNPTSDVLTKYCVGDDVYCGNFVQAINKEVHLISLIKSICVDISLGSKKRMCDNLIEKAKVEAWINAIYKSECNTKEAVTTLDICKKSISLCSTMPSDVCLDVNLQLCNTELFEDGKSCKEQIDAHCIKGNSLCKNIMRVANQNVSEYVFSEKCAPHGNIASCEALSQAAIDVSAASLIGKVYANHCHNSANVSYCQSMKQYCSSLNNIGCLPIHKTICASLTNCVPLLRMSCATDSELCTILVAEAAPNQKREMQLLTAVCTKNSSVCKLIIKKLQKNSIVIHSVFMESCKPEDTNNTVLCEILFETCDVPNPNTKCEEVVKKYNEVNAKRNVCEKDSSKCAIAFDAHCVSEKKNTEKCEAIFAGIGADKIQHEFGPSCSDDKREDVCKHIFEKLRMNKAWIDLIFDAHCTNALKSNECLKLKTLCEESDMKDSTQCRAIDKVYRSSIRIIAGVFMAVGFLLFLVNLFVFFRRRKKHRIQMELAAEQKQIVNQEANIL